MENTEFRTAAADDLPRILQIIEQARRRMAAAGSRQWQDGYPAPENIAADLANGYGHVICLHPGSRHPAAAAQRSLPAVGPDDGNRRGEVMAYGAIAFDGEPAYDALDGQWLCDQPYVVVHRLAVADEALGQNLGTEFLRHAERLACERGVTSFRVDTNFDNQRMLRILAREGFVRCGKVSYRGSEREAFEKRLTATTERS